MQRIKLYSQIATNLSALSNEKLKQILADGKPMHEGIGVSRMAGSLRPNPPQNRTCGTTASGSR